MLWPQRGGFFLVLAGLLGSGVGLLLGKLFKQADSLIKHAGLLVYTHAMTINAKLTPQQIVARVFDEFVEKLLSSNEIKSVPTPPMLPHWHALDEAERDDVVERLKIAVGEAIGGPWKQT